MDTRTKVLSLDQLPAWREEARRRGKKVVATNGCFDLLHRGHVTYLESAKACGDLLLVGINGDASVHQLKGAGRPINSQEDRAFVIAGLAAVDAVAIFPELRATRFLELVQPDVYVKGGDYTLESLDPEERAIVEGHGGVVQLIPFVPGKSTTSLLKKMEQARTG